jgi:hypothetical protein
LSITPNDLKTKEDPDIQITSKKEQQAKNEKQRQMFTALIPFLQQIG